MSLKQKLTLLNLSEEQEKIATEKFMASLSLVTLEEFTESIKYLETQGVKITKANQIKVLTNLCHELAKKFSVLGEVKETDIYRQEPNMLNKNVIDVYRRFQKCNQDGINYKNEDGTYKSFILTEKDFQKEIQSVSKKDEIPVIEPTVDVAMESPVATEETKEAVEPNNNIIDIQEFMKRNDEEAELDARTANFAAVKNELQAALADLDSLKNELNFNELSFNDIEPESYGMGRAA